MALIICSECGKEFSDKATVCPNCGCPLSFIKLDNQKDSELREESEDSKFDTVDSKSKADIMLFQDKSKKSKTIIGGIILIIIVISIMALPKVNAYQSTKNTYQSAQSDMTVGNKIAALQAFINLGSYKDSVSLVDQLKLDIYNEGIDFYHKEDYPSATTNFLAISDFKQSNGYLSLINIKTMYDYDGFNNNPKYLEARRLLVSSGKIDLLEKTSVIAGKLKQNIDFEDTKDVILQYFLEYFLDGSWETNGGEYYYTVTNRSGVYDYEFESGTMKLKAKPDWYTSYNIPWYEGENYKYENGIHYVGSDTGGWKEQYKITIKSVNEINIYCFKNLRTYVLHRL